MRTDVESGAALADAMKKHPRAFDALYSNMIAAGEAGGILDTILKRLAVYIEKNVKLKGQVKSAMIYPIAVIVIATIVVAAILWKVIPTFAQLFAGLGAQLPLPTRVVIAMSDGLLAYGPLIIIALGLIGYGLQRYYATVGGPLHDRRDRAEDADSRHDHAQDRGGAVLPHAVDPAVVGRADPRRAGHHGADRRQRGHRGSDPEDAHQHRARRDRVGRPCARPTCSRRWSSR